MKINYNTTKQVIVDRIVRMVFCIFHSTMFKCQWLQFYCQITMHTVIIYKFKYTFFHCIEHNYTCCIVLNAPPRWLELMGEGRGSLKTSRSSVHTLRLIAPTSQSQWYFLQTSNLLRFLSTRSNFAPTCLSYWVVSNILEDLFERVDGPLNQRF